MFYMFYMNFINEKKGMHCNAAFGMRRSSTEHKRLAIIQFMRWIFSLYLYLPLSLSLSLFIFIHLNLLLFFLVRWMAIVTLQQGQQTHSARLCIGAAWHFPTLCFSATECVFAMACSTSATATSTRRTSYIVQYTHTCNTLTDSYLWELASKCNNHIFFFIS